MSNVPCNRPDFCRPFRAMLAGELTQGKPWAMLSWPFGPQNHRGAWRFLTCPFLRFKRSPHSARETSQILLSPPAC
jgi:hypothetical protein